MVKYESEKKTELNIREIDQPALNIVYMNIFLVIRIA